MTTQTTSEGSPHFACSSSSPPVSLGARTALSSVPPYEDDTGLPFENAEEAWFWFMQAQTARNEGARIKASAGSVNRPCEPVDILRVLERLYRTRRLLSEHILVLKHYGDRLMPPDPKRRKEVRAYGLWKEAMGVIGSVLIAKGIVKRPHWLRGIHIESNPQPSK